MSKALTKWATAPDAKLDIDGAKKDHTTATSEVLYAEQFLRRCKPYLATPDKAANTPQKGKSQAKGTSPAKGKSPGKKVKPKPAKSPNKKVDKKKKAGKTGKAATRK